MCVDQRAGIIEIQRNCRQRDLSKRVRFVCDPLPRKMPHYEARIEITRSERFMRKNFREVILVAGNTQQYRLLQRGEQQRPRDFKILAPGHAVRLHRKIGKAAWREGWCEYGEIWGVAGRLKKHIVT